MIKRSGTMRFISMFFVAILVASLSLGTAHAATAASDFSLQVSPSPLVTTLKPGQTTTLELKIRNAGSKAENLKIEPRSFTFNDASGQVALNDTTPPDIAQWISFGKSTFTVQPGEWFTQNVKFSLPKDTGFSYSFALIISRQSDPKPTSGGRLVKGSVAVFTLVNVDRPGASRKLDVAHFSADKKVYEYLPASLNVRIKNTGNTIVQPYGNIYMQRKADAKSPITTLAINESKGYILPGTERSLPAKWSDGFPAYKSYTAVDGSTKQRLVWNWAKAADFRIGRYTAQLVAVYSDGQHDVPIRGEISFWVIPWKILIGLTVFVLLMLFGLWSLTRKIISLVRRGKRKKHNTLR